MMGEPGDRLRQLSSSGESPSPWPLLTYSRSATERLRILPHSALFGCTARLNDDILPARLTLTDLCQPPMEQSSTADPLAELITTYNELNSPIIEELDGEPSPLEFMRYVSRNTPFVVRNAAATWSATKTWNAQYLKDSLRDQTVNVAVTPKGFVDLLLIFFIDAYSVTKAPSYMVFSSMSSTRSNSYSV